MNSPTNDTALLLFTRSSTAEAAHKNLLGGRQARQNRRLLHQMIRHSCQTARRSGLPLFIHTEKEQQGQSFGERLAQSLEAVFSQGFSKVLVMGNDCLTLSPSRILEAAAALHEGKAVVAPTREGGVYLIGLHRNQFDPKSFAAVQWQTSSLYKDLCQLLQSADIALSALPPQADINDRKSLELGLAALSPLNAFRTFAKSLLAGLQLPFIPHCRFFTTRFTCTSAGLRAPPAYQ